MKITDIKLNPKNPRQIRPGKFEKLKKSLKDFEKMLSIRPIIVDENNVVLGGNMRLKALQELGYTELKKDWVKKITDLTEGEKREFIIKDNLEFGEYDFDLLANNYEIEELTDWGIDEDALKLSKLNFDEEQKEYDENIETNNECPRCGYKW